MDLLLASFFSISNIFSQYLIEWSWITSRFAASIFPITSVNHSHPMFVWFIWYSEAIAIEHEERIEQAFKYNMKQLSQAIEKCTLAKIYNITAHLKYHALASEDT